MKFQSLFENAFFFLVAAAAFISLACWVSSFDAELAATLVVGLAILPFRGPREAMEFFSEPPYNAEAESQAERGELDSSTKKAKAATRRHRL